MVSTSISSKSLSPIRIEPLPTVKVSLSRSITHLNGALTKVAEAVAQVALTIFATLGYILSFGQLDLSNSCGIDKVNTAFSTALNRLNRFYASLSEEGVVKIKIEKNGELARRQGILQKDNKKFAYTSAPADFNGQASTEKVRGYGVGICHYIGRRPKMEDEHLCTSFKLKVGTDSYPVLVFGVFDGHGHDGEGAKAAKYVKENLGEELHTTLLEACEREGTINDTAIWKALAATPVRLSNHLENGQAGTTATIAIIINDKLWTVNVGDSRTILDNGIQLTEDAKPTNPNYRKSIYKRGGFVDEKTQSISKQLRVARAIGDHHVLGLTAKPKIASYPLSSIPRGTKMILACDGVFDVASTRQVAEAIREHNTNSEEELAKGLVHSAYESGSCDNLTAMVVTL